MKSKNNINKIQSKDIEIIPKTPGNNKPNVNVNTYMKKSKRNNIKENNDDIITQADVAEVVPEAVIPDITTSIKALNLIKARQARKINIQNKNTSREEKILNLIKEIKEEEIIKVENKTEKLKMKLMKLI